MLSPSKRARASIFFVLSVSLLATSFPASHVAAVSDVIEGTVTVDHGDTLTHEHADGSTHVHEVAGAIGSSVTGGEFDPAGASYIHFVVTASGERVKIQPRGMGVELDLAPGQRVRLRGTRVKPAGPNQAATFELAAGDASIQVTGSDPVAAAPVNKRVAVLLVNFNLDARAPWTEDEVNTSLLGPGRTAATYFSETSQGAMSVTGDVFGWYTLNVSDLATCAYSSWGTAARSAASAAGVNLGAYTNIQYVFPRQNPCGWSGLATLGGSNSWLNGTISVGTSAHELGHNFRLHHASSYRCTSAGVAVPLSSTCTSSDYGDPFDNMGNGDNLAHAWHRRQLNAMDLSQVQTITVSGTYSVSPLYGTSGPRLLRIARQADTVNPYLYVDFRQVTGLFDTWTSTASVTNGVALRLGPDTALRQSQLIDSVPSTSTFTDAPLTVGRSLTDPVSGVTVSVISVASIGVTVQIAFPGVEPTPAPTASPTPAPTPSPKSTRKSKPRLPFTDISDSKFVSDIVWLADEKITSGCTVTTFCPDGGVTRGQLASFISRAMNLPATTRDYFSDDSGSLHEAAINRLAAAGITSGCGGTRFCPHGLVLRDQMASLLSRALDLPATNRNYFSDDTGNKHQGAINRLAASGITSGCAVDRYCPTGTVVRQQMAAFLHRGFQP